jgi:Zn-dependent protease with chaperone function
VIARVSQSSLERPHDVMPRHRQSNRARLALALLVAGCSTPAPLPPLVADAGGADRARLERIADALATDNAELCTGSVGTLKRPDPAKPKSPREQCKITFRLVPRPGVGAAGDGDAILLSAGMLGFVRDDDELATVMAHRMAHRLVEPPAPQPFLTRLGSDLGVADGRVPEPVFDPASERAADRVSLFLLARADRDPAAAVRFWQRMATLPPGANDWLARHAISAERIEAMTAITTEIAMLRAAGQPLKP